MARVSKCPFLHRVGGPPIVHSPYIFFEFQYSTKKDKKGKKHHWKDYSFRAERRIIERKKERKEHERIIKKEKDKEKKRRKQRKDETKEKKDKCKKRQHNTT